MNISTHVLAIENAGKAEKAYDKAKTAAEISLPSTHPIRLGLALNFSVFYYEIMAQPDKACTLAKSVRVCVCVCVCVCV